MDFGDILDQWEKSEKEVQKNENSGAYKKKANAPEKTSSKKENRINDMDLWMRRYGVVDKDNLVKDYEDKQREKMPSAAKKKPIDASIDLHNFTQEEAWEQLDIFVKKCKQRGLKKICIVHGKGTHSAGDPVLGNMVRLYIEQHKMLGESGHPKAADGGSGATWVMIK